MKDVEKQFESIAPQYIEIENDTNMSRYEMQVNWPSVRNMLPSAPAKVLDYGCGSGIYGRMLLQKGYDVMFADNSASMLEPLEDIKDRVRVWDYHDKPLPETFDAIIAKLVVQFIDDLPAFARLMRQQLKPGGRLIISIPNPGKSKALSEQQGSSRNYVDKIGASGLAVTMIHRDFQEHQDVMRAAGFILRQTDEPLDPKIPNKLPKRLNMLFEATQ